MCLLDYLLTAVLQGNPVVMGDSALCSGWLLCVAARDTTGGCSNYYIRPQGPEPHEWQPRQRQPRQHRQGRQHRQHRQKRQRRHQRQYRQRRQWRQHSHTRSRTVAVLLRHTTFYPGCCSANQFPPGSGIGAITAITDHHNQQRHRERDTSKAPPGVTAVLVWPGPARPSL